MLLLLVPNKITILTPARIEFMFLRDSRGVAFKLPITGDCRL